MPKFSAGLIHYFDFCEYNQKDFAAIQEKIVRHRVKSGENDVTLGDTLNHSYRVKQAPSWLHQMLLGGISQRMASKIPITFLQHAITRIDRSSSTMGFMAAPLCCKEKKEVAKILGQDGKV